MVYTTASSRHVFVWIAVRRIPDHSDYNCHTNLLNDQLSPICTAPIYQHRSRAYAWVIRFDDNQDLMSCQGDKLDTWVSFVLIVQLGDVWIFESWSVANPRHKAMLLKCTAVARQAQFGKQSCYDIAYDRLLRYTLPTSSHHSYKPNLSSTYRTDFIANIKQRPLAIWHILSTSACTSKLIKHVTICNVADVLIGQ